MKIIEGIPIDLLKWSEKVDGSKQKVDKRGKPKEGPAGEKVDISQAAKDISQAKEGMAGVPEVRVARVDEVRDALKKGKIEVDTLDLAEKIIREHLLEDIL